VLVEGPSIGADALALDAERRSSPPAVLLDSVAAVQPALVESLGDFRESERRKILAALEAHNWNRARAAKALGMPRRTFYRRLQEHRILAE
jgi:transcriptional regulator of acetoin/glycerol metabolism